ncbi:MAG: hypothetical protein V7637_2633 [Mycobacteriales bacterium]
MDVIGDAPKAPGRPARPRGPGRRGRQVLGVVAVLGLLGYAVTHRVSAPPAAGTRPGPDLSAPAGVLTGRPGFGPAGLRVLLTGASLRIVDLHTGGQQPVSGLPDGVDGAHAAPVQGGLIVYAGGAGSVDSYLVRPGLPTRLVVRNGVALPSWDGRGLVVVALPLGSEQYAVTGQTLAGRRQWHWLASNHALVIRDTRYGLLVQDTDPPPDPQRLRLVRRETGQVLRQLRATTVAVGDESVAHLRPGCARRCVLAVTGLATGAATPYPLPDEPATGHGSLSPGGRWLAMTVPAGPAPGVPPDRPSSVAVLDLRTGTVTAVPGLALPPGQTPMLDWSADGRSLIVAVPGADTVRLGIWRPGTPRTPVTVLPTPYRADNRTSLTVLP